MGYNYFDEKKYIFESIKKGKLKKPFYILLILLDWFTVKIEKLGNQLN